MMKTSGHQKIFHDLQSSSRFWDFQESFKILVDFHINNPVTVDTCPIMKFDDRLLKLPRSWRRNLLAENNVNESFHKMAQ